MAEPMRPSGMDHLEERLALLGQSIEWPAAPELAARVSARLAGAPAPIARRTGWSVWFGGGRPVRRAMLAAIALVLALAAAAAAVGLILPGLRIVFLPPGSSLLPVASVASAAPPSGPSLPGLPGAGLGLGVAVDPGEAAGLIGFEPLALDRMELGPPDATFVAADRLTQVWASRPGLPATRAAGVGLLVTQLAGRVDAGWFEKQVVIGAVDVEQVRVAGLPAWWVTGEPHSLVYVDAAGRFVEETRRVVGDVLLWQHGEVTLRIESALGREATIDLAETLTADR